ncbi:nucleotidyltransferase domain protein [bacterium BMS3Abin14]|nr:nucleotidyltransferase domain protein [bacterium BMS3Abin14]
MRKKDSGKNIEHDLDQVKRLVLKGLLGHDAQVFLFGSHATGKAGRASDIDVAVLPVRELPAGLLSRIRESLQESYVPFSVELVDLSQTDEAFRERVLAEGIIWTV